MNRVLVAAVLLLTPSLALAQVASAPFGGLFGRAPERIGREFTALDFRGSAGPMFDDALNIDESAPESLRPENGLTASAIAALTFERQTDRTFFNTRGTAQQQEYLRDKEYGAAEYDIASTFRGNVTTRFQVEGAARYVRSPFFRMIPMLPIAVDGTVVSYPGDPYYVRLLTNDSYEGRVGFSSQYTKRSSLSGSVTTRQVRYLDGDLNTYDSRSAQALWSRRLTRDLTLRAGYGREMITQTATPGTEFVHELVDLGVDFMKHLSLSRKTTFGVTSQMSMVKRPLTGRRYRVNGGANLARLFGKTGYASLGFNRSTEFLPGFFEPLFSDMGTASLGGMLSPRIEVMLNANAGHGQFGFDGQDKLLTAQGRTRINFGVARHFGLYAQYALYYYELPQTSAQVPLLPQMARQQISAGISTWVPLINKIKVPRDPE